MEQGEEKKKKEEEKGRKERGKMDLFHDDVRVGVGVVCNIIK